jgi:hypothetical protein
VPAQTARKPLDLQLWFGDVLVADLFDAMPHQGTWFARYRPVVALGQGPLQQHLCDFIAFCEEWHRRLKRGENPAAAEFDSFADVLRSGSWRALCPDGTGLTMTEGPIFVEGEASWNHPEDRPSRELTAQEAWSRMSRRCT